ncbi:MAG: 2-C-methyl-D-erythritol 2,4-cyclodiphosphate synthase [Myxococcales bacterium]|nr:2-C-methyl-D-erythritol 2,4-cyclodiphosphate synthase [Myxococcales bacterium]MDH5307873.1 2-C-methyl-D-erythritol 2,4-cyclodiphosphate synthase [Myxococcales bacterium]MDH5566003.1 2-C-methyl-D-erythritol 2,4-cyclodiphosphate synthase [Myxococcales bacterium]
MRIGQGIDAHRLVAGRPLRLGGVEIPHPRGLEGHSDGDVLLHAIASALLGALGEGDLGRHFPSSDPALAGIASGEIVARVMAQVRARGYALGNVDATVVAQEPRLAPHLDTLRGALADLLGVDSGRVNVKVTSTDHLGAIGRGEGIAALAVVLLEAA